MFEIARIAIELEFERSARVRTVELMFEIARIVVELVFEIARIAVELELELEGPLKLCSFKTC